MNIKLASQILFDSIVDGPGLRTVIFFQGCTHNCLNCQNPQTHDFNGGFDIDINIVIEKVLNKKLQSGVTFSGGDPMSQAEQCTQIAKELKKHNINIWCYTGFTYDFLIQRPIYNDFLQYIDVLVDGVFVDELKSYELKFRGSSNQRLIDVQKSLKENKIILWEEM